MSILGCFLVLILAIGALTCPVQAVEAEPPYPNVKEMCSEPFDEDFLDGVIACGWDALRYRMRDNIYRTNIGRLDDIHLTQFERLLVRDPGNPNMKDAAYWGLRRELENLRLSGDMQEFNLLEGHWCNTNGYDAMKAYISDPELSRMAHMIAERIWINRFLTWSAAVERNTGPVSRMAPGAWIACSRDRMQCATGVEKPIWVNNNFIRGNWQKIERGGRWPLDDVEGMIPDLSSYLHDIAWRKQYPNELQCSVQLVPWMDKYPKLPGISHARHEPVLGKYVNYQTKQYAIGSITHAWDASAGMFLFRWRPGTNGMYINREAMRSLPAELQPGDWWFIHDGDTYVAVRTLEATHLRGPCKSTLEQRTHQIVLYQDNYVGETIEGITNKQWVKARSGFIVEIGDADEYGSFENFQKTMLKAEVKENADGFVQHIKYKRPGLSMEMKWHCYEEKCLLRRINGKDDPWVQYLYSPEFVVSNSGELRTHDTMLKTTSDETLWLLSCAPSQTYVAYQPHPHCQLPLKMDSPIARIESKRFPFGKLIVRKIKDEQLEIEINASFRPFWSSVHWRAEVWKKLGTHPGNILIYTNANQVTANINGDEMPVKSEIRNGRKVWVIDPYARIPRIRDRVGKQRG